jgi:NhaP-type Na+/H+ or K+/H+ antiporter
MIDNPLSGLALIAIAALVAQWLGARVGVPSVLFLLGAGVAVGPVLDPDELYGDVLFSAVGLGVAVLLFQGGTSLRWRELTLGRAPVLRLVTIGAAIAWAVGAIAAAAVLDVDTGIAILIGAVLIVSGPTVMMPLLQVVRAREPVDSILRWEGILIDPIGAALAVVVLDALVEERSPGGIIVRISTTVGAGLAVGALVAAAILWILTRQLISDQLHVPATFAALIAAYAVANELRPEAGLIAATVLGIAFANQRRAPASHIAEFNDNLGTSVLGMLFVVLGARIDLGAVADHLAQSAIIAAALMLIARPVSVIAATIGGRTMWRTRGFLMALAPRGVVAAAVASLFALELEHQGIDPGPLVPVVFTVVVITVTFASLTASFAARRLLIAQPEPHGVALIGGGAFAVAFAGALGRLHVPTIHIGLDEEHQTKAIAKGQRIYDGRIDSDDFHRTTDAMGLSAGVALSGVDHLDRYATERLATTLHTSNLYRLADPTPADDKDAATSHAVDPRLILPDHITAEHLTHLMTNGTTIRTTRGAHRLDAGWLTICRVDRTGTLTFDQDPTTAADTDWLVQLGPDLTTTRGGDCVDESLLPGS